LNSLNDQLLNRILRSCGTYYQPRNLFFHHVWRERLVETGLRVLSVEKFEVHEVWLIRMVLTLSAQAFLLFNRPIPEKLAGSKDVLSKQLELELRTIAKGLGLPIERGCVCVVRSGKYLRASFIWPCGKPGRLIHQPKKAHHFSLSIQPWLRKTKN